MADIISPQQRSAVMSRIRSANTKIELEVRRALHALGFRYRLGGANLPGRPDIVLPKYRTVIFVHGCFWHGHDCYLFRTPKTRTDFWTGKIETNRQRDIQVEELLKDAGWHVEKIWECQLRGRSQDDKLATIEAVAARIALRNDC